jgi:hypothetical protein
MRLQGDGLLDSQCGHGRAVGHNTLQHRRLGIACLCGACIQAEKNRGLVMGYYVEQHETGKPGDFKRDTAALKSIGGAYRLDCDAPGH